MIVTAMRNAVLRALDDRAAGRVRSYFDPTRNYAGATFNTLGRNDRDSVGADDLMAVALLSIKFDARTVREIIDTNGSEISRHLVDIPDDIDLWDPKADVSEGSPSSELWTLLTRISGVGWVTAGKIMARKRPRLIPILDEVVKAELDPPPGQFWVTLRGCLDDDLRGRIEAVRPPDVPVDQVSTLRILDVAVWMKAFDE